MVKKFSSSAHDVENPVFAHPSPMHRRKCSNELLPGVDLQILFLVEYVVSYILFPSSFAEILSVDADGSFM